MQGQIEKVGSRERVGKGYKMLKVTGKCKHWYSALSCFLSGPSIAIILPEIALTYVMVVTFLVSATVTFQPTKFIQLRSKTGELCDQGLQGVR